MISFFKTVFISVLSISVIAACATDQDKKTSYFQKGTQYYESKEYKKAEIEFKNALQIDNKYSEALIKLAETKLKLGDIRAAYRIYSQAEQLIPYNTHLLTNLARIYFLGEQFEKAKERIEKILEVDSNNIDALHLKAKLLTVQKEFNSAERIYNKILDIDEKNVNSLQELARLKNLNREFEKAEKLLIKAAEITPEAIQPRLALSSFYISRGDMKNAENQLKSATEKNPDNIDIHIVTGNFYLRMRNIDLAEFYYKKAVEISPNMTKPHLILAGFYDIIDNEEAALESYHKAVKLDSNNITAKQALARFLYKNEDIDSAYQLTSEILAKRPNFYAAKELNSEIMIYKKKYNEALKILASLEKEEPKAPRVYYLKALANIGIGNSSQALSAAGKAVELKPAYIKARTLLSDILLHQRSFVLAAEQTDEILKLNPNHYKALLIRGNARLALGQLDLAESDYTSMVKVDSQNPTGYYRLGLVKMKQKKYLEAEDYLKKALSKNNMLMDVFTQLVRNHVSQKNFDKAHELCETQLQVVKSNNTMSAAVYNIKAGVYLAENKIDQAKNSYEKAIKENPDFLRPYFSIANIYLAQGNKTEAVRQYEHILTKKPEISAPHMILGTIFDMEQQHEKAELHYRKALEINPDFAPAANNLAYHLAKRTDKLNEALNYARMAKELLPEDPGVMDTLGLVYYKKGLYGNAINEFLDSLKQIPDNPVVHYHLGLAYNKRGEIKLAKKELEKALALNSSFEGSEIARKLLEQ